MTPPEGLTATDATAIIKKDVALSSNSGTIEIENTDVADTVEPGAYFYSIYIRMDNNDVYPFANGKFKIVATPTNRET